MSIEEGQILNFLPPILDGNEKSLYEKKHNNSNEIVFLIDEFQNYNNNTIRKV